MREATGAHIALAVAVCALAACGPKDSRTVLTVYSPHGKELETYFEHEFEKAHPDVDVQWDDIPAQSILDRVRAEQANPQADVWFGAPAEIFDHAASENLLAAYKPSWAAAIVPDARDAHDRWYGTFLTPEVIAYNSEAVSDADAPKDWDDVLDPKWKGKVLIRDPVQSGTMRAIFAAIIQREMTRTGSTAAGFDWLRRLDANTKEYTLDPSILYQKIGRQEGVITLWDMPDIATLEQRTKIPVKYVIPASGTPLLVDGIALLRGGKHPELARAFYEFVTTPAALDSAASKFLRIPARTDLPTEGLPSWIRDAKAQIRPMPLDRKLLADSLNIWMTYWDANIRRRGGH